MREYLNIGSTPCEEVCAQVGTENYEVRAKAECRAYIEAIRQVVGPEPEGAQLAIKGFDHDFGRYYEVVCWYDTDDEESEAYAFRCEGDAPSTWPEGIAPKLTAA